MKKNALKSIVAIVLMTIAITLFSCGNTTEVIDLPQEAQQTIHGAFGDNFELYLWDSKSRQLLDDKVRFSIKAVLEKENDITDKNDFVYGDSFLKYSYSVSINGTLDSKYTGRRVFLYLQFIPEYSNTRCSESMVVSENGTISGSYVFYSNAIFTEWVPYSVRME